MADIVNISRTYTFTNGITLVNSQLESEISNIVDRINKNISILTDNVFVQSFVTSSLPTAFGGSGVILNLMSISLGVGEFDINAMVGCQALQASGTVISRWAGGISTSISSIPDGYLAAQDGIIPPPPPVASSSNSYIVIPPHRTGVVSPTTFYFNCLATYTGGAPYAFGVLQARRVST